MAVASLFMNEQRQYAHSRRAQGFRIGAQRPSDAREFSGSRTCLPAPENRFPRATPGRGQARHRLIWDATA
jgi:hypothetical protein